MMRWRILPWLASLVCLACSEPRVADPGARPIQQTTFERLNASQLRVDLLFVIDNSASMAAKQARLLESLSTMMGALEKLNGGLLDVHIGVVSSDLGAGMGEAGGDCSVPLGDRGLLWGNDPDPGARATVAGGNGAGCGLAAGARWIESRRCPDGSGRHRNYEGQLSDVLSCVVKAMGTRGCGYSHALRAAGLALDPQPGLNDANRGFLRSNAYLHMIFISDKDDCSASGDSSLNDRLFSADNPGDNPVLRCAARGHVCGGQAIPHYIPATGFDGAQGGFSYDFNSCVAKEPTNPADPGWLPLVSVQEIIDGVKRLKQEPEHVIAAAGVIGLPSANGKMPSEYRIDNTQGQDPWHLSPICGVPADGGEDTGVYPAYRLRRFIESFHGDDEPGLLLSMCDGHWEEGIRVLGEALIMPSRPACVSFPLIDSNPTTPDIQPDCQISMSIAGDESGACGGAPAHEVSIPECADVATGLPVNPANPRPQLDSIPEDRRPCWYFLHDRDENTGCPKAFEHQRLAILYKPEQVSPPGSMWTVSCRTSPYPPVNGQRVE